MFYRLRKLVPPYILRTLYYSMVGLHSRVQYEIILWGSTFHSTLRELEVRLNDIVRTMTSRRKFDHVSPLHKYLSLLKLQDIYKLELAKFMCQLSFNKLPKIIESAFPKIENIHNHNTRHTQNTKFFYLEQWISTFFLSWPIFCCTKVLWPINFLSFLNEYSSPGADSGSIDGGMYIILN